jgi:hypothetical protein
MSDPAAKETKAAAPTIRPLNFRRLSNSRAGLWFIFIGSFSFVGVLALALVPDSAERFLGFGGGQALAGVEHPDAALLFERADSALRPQDDLVPLNHKFESVADGEMQVVPEGLGKQYAARSVKAHLVSHTAIIKWHHPFYKWHPARVTGSHAGGIRGQEPQCRRCGSAISVIG